MFIKNLRISKGSGEIIRDINFKKGINLIVDETSKSDLQESGNNVGKTTILRLIDYCLGSNGKNIYLDTEFRDKSNTKIEEFLKKERVLISLILVENSEEPDSFSIVIERNFLENEDKICRINGESYEKLNEEFCPKLKELIFKSVNRKPTLRQIISKNIRDEKNKLWNVLKVLHPTTTQEEYESLYLFWLGIDLNYLDKKQELQRKKQIEEQMQLRFKKDKSYSEIIQSLLVIGKNISELEKTKSLFTENKNYEADLESLNEVKSRVSRLSTQLSQLELRKELILESKKDLESEVSKIDAEKIEQLYTEAKVLIPNIQKSFEDTINFHNQMISEKINYIVQELPQTEEVITKIRKEISSLLFKEKTLIERIKKSGLIVELGDIIIKLNTLYEEKGKFEEKKANWEKSREELKSINSQLKEINKSIETKDSLIQERIAKFNEFFSALSNRLYGEEFILSSDKNKKGYELNVSSIAGNLGTGKKKVLIIAFDFAYVQFADSLGIKCLHFILHDQIENVHSNQITNILTEIIKDVNCQYIIPVLKDKLPQDIDVESMKVIALSQKNKLFRLP